MLSSAVPTAGRPTDVRVVGAAVYFLPVATRVPLKFGVETLTSVTCCRVRIDVRDRCGRTASGWGETPLSVQWGWPSNEPYAYRHDALQRFSCEAARSLAALERYGHPIELGHDFQTEALPAVVETFNRQLTGEPLPYLAALIGLSPADVALHDAYGNLHGMDVYDSYNDRFMSRDLSGFLSSDDAGAASFQGRYPADFLVNEPPATLTAWHLVGGLDPIDADDLTGRPLLDDGYPELLADWIRTDGLACLKVKLRGTDAAWDYERLVRVADAAVPLGVQWLSADFNCTVEAPEYVGDVLDRLQAERPVVWNRLLYVEQPFPYELEKHPLRVEGIAARKPLFLDESAHDWRYVRLGRSLGWTGACLKTCKTQTGSLLSLCWAKAHGMQLMVQDLTNPMLAQIPHVRLAAHAGTLMGVESNAMQFYPAASLPEAAIHPGLYQRRGGRLDLRSLAGSGFGYRLGEIDRRLPAPAAEFR